MIEASLGTLSKEDDSFAVRIERQINAPIQKVWEALTSPEWLNCWLAEASVEPRLGGSIEVDFSSDGVDSEMRGIIRAWNPPHELEYTWDETNSSESIVRFELSEDGGATKLLMTHRLLALPDVPNYGAGWHSHLDKLTELVETGSSPTDFLTRYVDLRPTYVERAARLD